MSKSAASIWQLPMYFDRVQVQEGDERAFSTISSNLFHICMSQEWRPDRGQGKVSRVALLQLASSSVAVLVRTCLLDWQLPPCVQGFLR
jgi:hypothetical protein